jgi:biotin transport system substrate-specific component
MAELSISELRRLVHVTLMATLTAVGAYLQVPIGPVPLVLQNVFVLLAGLLFGWRSAGLSMGLYLLLGALGLPIFAGGKGGAAHLLGPTGGYLFGFVLAACLTSWLARVKPGHWVADGVAVMVGSIAIYALGVPWLKWVTGLSWQRALAVGMLPFLIGDAVKAAAAVLVARAMRPLLAPQGNPSMP